MKHFVDVDDFQDGSRPPAIDWVEWLLNGIFATAGAAMMAYIAFLAMQAYIKL